MINTNYYKCCFQVSGEGQEFLLYLMECLFALPNPRTRDEPKAKSTISRTSCYDLLVELAKGSLGNYLVLHGKLLDQHRPDSHLPYQWEYWPREDGRAECGFVGLTNLGSTCYMATCMQQLFMIPDARDAVLRADPLMTEGTEGGRHAATLRELQKMFAYLRLYKYELLKSFLLVMPCLNYAGILSARRTTP